MDKRLLTVIKKELKRVFTDKRLVFSTMILPALSIFIIYSLMGNMITNMEEDLNQNIAEILVIDAPDSWITFLDKSTEYKNYKLSYDHDLKQYKEELRNGNLEILLVFEANFDDKVFDYKNPNIERYYNKSEEYSSEAKWHMDNTLKAYEEYLLGLRIGSQEHVNVFDLNRGIDANIEDAQKSVGKALAILFPMLIAIFLFTGAMSVGADIIAGEKERGTMATLLVTPVSRGTLATGKIIALAIIAIISATSSFIGIIASLPAAGNMLSSSEMDILNLQFSLVEFSSLGLIMLSLVGLYVALICTVSVIAKSVKEANTYMAPIYMVVVMSGFLTMYSEGTGEIWRFAIPIYGSIIALKNLFAFELTRTMLLYTCGASMVYTSIAMYFIKALFNNENIMFGK